MKEILFITTYPPRECGIATFSHDLISAIQNKFGGTYTLSVCALESNLEKHTYSGNVKYKMNTSEVIDFTSMVTRINEAVNIEAVCIQHEFGLFNEYPHLFLFFIKAITKPVVIVFHTVLPNPDRKLKLYLQRIIQPCAMVVVMTHNSSQILQKEYQVKKNKIRIIPHGTHLVSHKDKRSLKEEYGYTGRKILSTFGLLSPGKSIETTLDALPAIVSENPSVLFLIIGKTHPTILKTEGDKYRDMLTAKVTELGLTEHVRFINYYLNIRILLDYLQLTDIYLFTSCDPFQAVSGTFVYALSCGCPIIATPIPHALELLHDNSGIIFDFKNSTQLAGATNRLLNNNKQQSRMRIAGLQKIAATAWENVAVAYASLFKEIIGFKKDLEYTLPPIHIDHIKRMSRNFAMIQFSKGNRPDIATGYTLDDNARALMAICNMMLQTKDLSCEKYVKSYLNFIKYCFQPDGTFLNYVDKNLAFTRQNQEVSLEDSNGRAICALGYFVCMGTKFPGPWIAIASQMIKHTLHRLQQVESPRSIAFILKGLAYYYRRQPSPEIYLIICSLADKLISYYKANVEKDWLWFEPYLTYDNSILPESLLFAYTVTENELYREIAKESFDFLLEKIFTGGQIRVISNQGWLQKESGSRMYGEQPIDVAGTVMALGTFYEIFHEEAYLTRQKEAFNWFLGNNHLQQIIYNPATGGCYDGLEENNINLNQGAESSVCYLMARLSLKYK